MSACDGGATAESARGSCAGDAGDAYCVRHARDGGATAVSARGACAGDAGGDCRVRDCDSTATACDRSPRCAAAGSA